MVRFMAYNSIQIHQFINCCFEVSAVSQKDRTLQVAPREPALKKMLWWNLVTFYGSFPDIIQRDPAFKKVHFKKTRH